MGRRVSQSELFGLSMTSCSRVLFLLLYMGVDRAFYIWPYSPNIRFFFQPRYEVKYRYRRFLVDIMLIRCRGPVVSIENVTLSSAAVRPKRNLHNKPLLVPEVYFIPG